MAGGPLFPYSAHPVTAGRVFPNTHIAAAANSKHERGMGVEASVGADSIWRLRFECPGTLPSGTGKIRLRALAAATTGNAKVNVKWRSVAMEEDPAGSAPTAEGVSTLTWAAGDSDVYKELKVTLDADTLVGGEIVVVDLTFETALWTLAVVSTWTAAIIWE